MFDRGLKKRGRDALGTPIHYEKNNVSHAFCACQPALAQDRDPVSKSHHTGAVCVSREISMEKSTQSGASMPVLRLDISGAFP